MIHCNASHIASAAEPPVVRAYLPGDRRSIAGPAPTRKWARSQIRHISEPHPLWQAVPAELVASGAPLPEHLIGGIVALGNFDGFHIGHQAVVRKAVELARARGVCALVAAFDPHPVSYFRQGSAPFQLTSLRQRQSLTDEFVGGEVEVRRDLFVEVAVQSISLEDGPESKPECVHVAWPHE